MYGSPKRRANLVELVVGDNIVRNELIEYEANEAEADDGFPEADWEHEAADYNEILAYVNTVSERQKQIIAEDVDFILEDLQNLADWGYIEEEVDRGE